ncbi:MAG: hypothetical protein M1834_005823 [Cirrosporium novae-zelandiae]|nr:MAG: hypothetical protein M1834_005823 [Cirrosporium novae-zelandiae]
MFHPDRTRSPLISEADVDVEDPLLQDVHNEADTSSLSRGQAWNLYTSHFLSTWNARTYEFAAILFTASAYPDTLLASSIRGIIITLSSLCFSPVIGKWIDDSPSRLKTLLSTISVNRCSVIIACLFWSFIVGEFGGSNPQLRSLQDSSNVLDKATTTPSRTIKNLIFMGAVSSGIFEKLSGTGNMLSMERDWVPQLASPSSVEDQNSYSFLHLNAIMKRIDLTCKLVAPIVISFVISLSSSTRIGVFTVAGMSGLSWGLEIFCAGRVWARNLRLHLPKQVHRESRQEQTAAQNDNLTRNVGTTFRNRIRAVFSAQVRPVRQYLSTGVCIPSLTLAVLYLSVLSYSATFMTFLLDSGFSLILITIARTIGGIVEVSSTFLTPWGIKYLSRTSKIGRFSHHNDLVAEARLLDGDADDLDQQKLKSGIERLGLWAVNSQVILLLASLPSIFHLTTSTSNPILTSFALFVPLTFSRLSTWTFDLSTQILTPLLLSSNQSLASFASVERSFKSFFELLQWIITAIWPRPEQFPWLAVGTSATIAGAAAMYAGWVGGREQRGHLVHWEKVCRGIKG